MKLIDLPVEILLEIKEPLAKQRDLASLIRVSRRLYHVFNEHLYYLNIEHHNCSALWWAAGFNKAATARKALSFGADVSAAMDDNFIIHRSTRDFYFLAGSTPLHLAAKEGHLDVVKALLEAGANTGARGLSSKTPLFYALAHGHEKVARTIFRYVTNRHTALVDFKQRLTALHMACHKSLTSCVTLFLKEGADPNAVDASALTPLLQVLLYNFGARREHCNYKDIFTIVRTLLDFGADLNFESGLESKEGNALTARHIGHNYPDFRVRSLFGQIFVNAASLSGTTRTHSIHYHHRNSPNYRPFSERGTLTSNDDGNDETLQEIDDNAFPTLHPADDSSVRQSMINKTESPWSPSKIANLIEAFSIAGDLSVTQAEGEVRETDPFPRLTENSSDAKQGMGARTLWTAFRKPKDDVLSPTGVVNDEASETNTVNMTENEKRSKKKCEKKKQWQPLQL